MLAAYRKAPWWQRDLLHVHAVSMAALCVSSSYATARFTTLPHAWLHAIMALIAVAFGSGVALWRFWQSI